MDINLMDNASEKRYEALVDCSTARIEYIKAQNKIYLTHTKVPKAIEGINLG
tara:strand:+ start:909 stop:1064 length:156 start_codon:yes stop_codon:yes gene_type:complete